MAFTPSLSQIKRVIETMQSDNFPAPPALDLFQEVYKLQLAFQKKLNFASIYKKFVDDMKPKKVTKVEDFLTLEKIDIDWSETRKLLGRMLRAAAEVSEPDDAAALKKLAARKHLNAIELEPMVRAALIGDEPPELTLPTEVDPDVLAYLGFSAVQPYFRVCARGIESQRDYANWIKGYCPVCGNEPIMAVLEPETGKRMLCCRVCDTQWGFPRLMCPFCQNQDNDKLGAYFFEDDEPFSIDYCKECNRYLKAYDLRKAGAVETPYPPLLDILSLELDALAEGKGLGADKTELH